MKAIITHELPMPKYENVYNDILDRLSDHESEMFVMLGDEESAQSPMIVFERVFALVLPDTVEYTLTDHSIVIQYEAFVFDSMHMGKEAVQLLQSDKMIKAYFKMLGRYDEDEGVIWKRGFKLLCIEVDVHPYENTVILAED